MAEPQRRRDRSQMRKGYTTGSNATAAALAATRALLTQTPQEQVTIHLPVGRYATFTLHRCSLGPDTASCSCIKDGGDDPDVTHGAEIGATVTFTDTPGLTLDRGPGVGLVTRPGLGLEVGGPAINPVPWEMITSHVKEEAGELLETRGLRVEIWVTDGEEIAKKTLNARLGIVGGISILGTTGVVIPYSTAAYRASVSQGIDVAQSQGCDHLVFTTGGRSERFAQALLPHLPDVAFIQVGEFLDWSLKNAAGREGIRKVTVAGMVGKLSKAAQGQFALHRNHSRVDPLFLAELAAECGASPGVVEEIKGANTARHFQEICLEAGINQVFDRICQLCCVRMQEDLSVRFEVETILTDFDGTVLGRADTDGPSANTCPPTVDVVGVLDDGAASLSPKMLALVAQAEVLVGGKRHLAFFPDHLAEKWPIQGPLEPLLARIREERRKVVVLASGDPNFYGIASRLVAALGSESVNIHPNVSAMALAFARVKISWDGALLTSVHGRSLDGLVDQVRGAQKVGLFTDRDNAPDVIGRLLLDAGVRGYRAFVCENLGGPRERVVETDLESLTAQQWAPLNVLILVREEG